MKICTVCGCHEDAVTRGWCPRHYQRWRKYGDPKYPVKKYLNTPEERWEAWTEWVGECLIWTGSANGGGYGQLIVSRETIYAHRYAWEREHGPIPEGKVIDHKDHCDTRCVNVKHLRLATKAQNTYNRSGRAVNNKSGYRNIFWCGDKEKYRAVVKGMHVGYFYDLEEAAKEVENKRRELFGEFAGRG